MTCILLWWAVHELYLKEYKVTRHYKFNLLIKLFIYQNKKFIVQLRVLCRISTQRCFITWWCYTPWKDEFAMVSFLRRETTVPKICWRKTESSGFCVFIRKSVPCTVYTRYSLILVNLKGDLFQNGCTSKPWFSPSRGRLILFGITQTL